MEYRHCCFFFFFFFTLLIIFADGRGSQVKFLSGFDGPLPFELETGYIGVEEGENVQFFYYFVKSTSDHPEIDPLILWMVGGPGCSGINGILFEIEEYDGGLPTVVLNPYAWTQAANIIFMDLPVGTGFSYAKTPEALHCTGMQSCEQAYEFLRKWLVDHPEFNSNPFYIGGHSCTGMTVPVIAQLISKGNDKGIKPQINLKGYILGNAMAFPGESNYRIPYAHGMGLISDKLFQSLKRNCRGEYENISSRNKLCLQDVQTYDQLIDGLNEGQILAPKCIVPDDEPFFELDHVSLSQRPNKSEKGRFLGKRNGGILDDGKPYERKCYFDRSAPVWANDPSVQEALHIREGSKTGPWVLCNHSLPYTDVEWDTRPYHAYLSAKGYRSLIYNGDHDMIFNFLATQAWIRTLNYSVAEEWRQWLVEGLIAGYTNTHANNMTYVTVKGGSHVAPGSHPKQCAAMFKRWISYQPL